MIMPMTRIPLMLMSRSGRINWIKKQPVEIRYQLRNGGVPFEWSHANGVTENFWFFLNSIKYSLSHKYRIGRDWWDLDTATSLWMLPRLRVLYRTGSFKGQALKEDITDPLTGLATLNEGESIYQTGQEIMSDIIFAFEYNLLVSMRGGKTTKEGLKRRNRGFRHFSHFYDSLWY